MFLNRELSWLKFNERVLMMAKNESLPLLERFKFVSIFAGNLDEFFMVRVSAIMNQIRVGYSKKDPSGHYPDTIYEEIHRVVKSLVEIQYAIASPMFGELASNGIVIERSDAFFKTNQDALESYFDAEVFPVLTPMGVDVTRRFPLVANKQLHIGVEVEVNDDRKLAIVQVPSVLPRLIKWQQEDHRVIYLLLEDLIAYFIDKLFVGCKIFSLGYFRITRNADIQFVEEEAEDLLLVIEEAVKLRKWGETVRLETNLPQNAWLTQTLSNALELKSNQIYEINGMLDLTVMHSLKPTKRFAYLVNKPYLPVKMTYKKNLFKQIRQGDIMVHHPFDAFDMVLDFIKEASKDPNVLAIKQTLYRVSGDSPIVKALGEAAERGKQVTVLLELLARFDEENNIQWAKKLEQRGVHVIYGLFGLKTHSKITMVVRKEKNAIKRYLHLATGNYNDLTAKLYTDMGLFTCRENYAKDATIFFNMVSGYANRIETSTLAVSPVNLREKFYDLIDREIEMALQGKKALIRAKMNALVDEGMIRKLYEASSKGVEVKLLVRGICTLVPSAEGLSERIEVRSIVGEYLEHSRIYAFENSGIYLSSADWMTRNLSRRVELLFPIEDEAISLEIEAVLDLYFSNMTKCWTMTPEGNYIPSRTTDETFDVQQVLKKSE